MGLIKPTLQIYNANNSIRIKNRKQDRYREHKELIRSEAPVFFLTTISPAIETGLPIYGVQ